MTDFVENLYKSNIRRREHTEILSKNRIPKIFEATSKRLYFSLPILLFSLLLLCDISLQDGRNSRLNSRILRIGKLPLKDVTKDRQQKYLTKPPSYKISENGNGVKNIHFSAHNKEINALFTQFLKQQQKQQNLMKKGNTNYGTGLLHEFQNNHLTDDDNKNDETTTLTTSLVPNLGSKFSTTLPASQIGITYPDSTIDSEVVLDLTSLTQHFPIYRQLARALLDPVALERAYRAVQRKPTISLNDVAATLLPSKSSHVRFDSVILFYLFI